MVFFFTLYKYCNLFENEFSQSTKNVKVKKMDKAQVI